MKLMAFLKINYYSYKENYEKYKKKIICSSVSFRTGYNFKKIMHIENKSRTLNSLETLEIYRFNEYPVKRPNKPEQLPFIEYVPLI